MSILSQWATGVTLWNKGLISDADFQKISINDLTFSSRKNHFNCPLLSFSQGVLIRPDQIPSQDPQGILPGAHVTLGQQELHNPRELLPLRDSPQHPLPDPGRRQPTPKEAGRAAASTDIARNPSRHQRPFNGNNNQRW